MSPDRIPWLLLGLAFLVFAARSLLRYRKHKAVPGLFVALGWLIPGCAFAYLAFSATRPQLEFVNAAGVPILVSIDGERDMESLAPTHLLNSRYDVGSSIRIWLPKDGEGPGESVSFPLPTGEDRQIFKARAVLDASGAISIQFEGATVHEFGDGQR